MVCSSSHVFFYVSLVPPINAGTTSTVALLRDGIELVVGSVGDSRAMLCRKGKALKLTVDHTPERKDEKERYHDAVSAVTDSCALRPFVPVSPTPRDGDMYSKFCFTCMIFHKKAAF